jgi:cell wall-associated NlpC family hydrolase
MSTLQAGLSRAARPLLVLFLAVAALVAAQTVPTATPAAHAATLHERSMAMRHRAVHIASLQKGKPYRWGADGPHAFDCSGLVKYVYGRLGHRLPHSARLIYLRTRHLSHRKMRPGDIIFMNVNGGGPRGIDHVGIYAGHHSWWVARHTGTTITRQHLWTSHFWVGRVRLHRG